MKTLQIILITLTFGLNCFGQTPRQLTKADSTQIETEVEMKSQNLKDSLLKSDLKDDNLYIEFITDTFRIEQRQRLKLDIDYSTNGMVISTLDANREYDKLLNKYYQLLLSSLNEEDKEILKKSQRNWIDFRDSELELNRVLMNDYYSGGGTIQRVFAAARVLEITRDRVIELYRYLNRKMK
ncbi:lysozyme inhibitor LprI family protein [uncultured Winogradskyella sp.]|uniref:lysozyme inhibitor LprI family protein n=1 Tax=uncultured Winogradskyella sp. TaxID=395353 RepID=UPI003513F41B